MPNCLRARLRRPEVLRQAHNLAAYRLTSRVQLGKLCLMHNDNGQTAIPVSALLKRKRRPSPTFREKAGLRARSALPT